MSFPENIDFDKVADHALSDAGYAMNKWIKGTPRSEEAFMNQLTGRLARNRRGCDVGVRQRVDMATQHYTLHRQGSRQTDAYGADLAVTIIVPNLPDKNDPYVKTAFFQFKKSQHYSVKVEKDQLEDAAKSARVYNRSYVLAIDESRQGYRLHKIDGLRKEFDPGQDTKTFQAWDWSCLTNWINDWFSCDEGPESNPNNPNSVEKVLASFIDEDIDATWASRDEEVLLDFPDELLPSETWLVFVFKETEEK
jgi:hypothetical protein